MSAVRVGHAQSMTDLDDQHVNELKKEFASAEDAKRLTQQLAEERMQELNSLADKLRKLNESSSHTLGQLPRILQTVMNDKNFGVMVLGADGKILLFNPAIQSLLGLKPGETSFDRQKAGIDFFLDEKSTAVPAGALPWEQSKEASCKKLLVKHRSKNDSGAWIQAHCVPLTDDSNVRAGAVLVISDISEQVRVERELQEICDSLETQIEVIETAKTDLDQLASRLGTPQWKPVSEKPGEENSSKKEVDLDDDDIIKTVLVVDDLQVNRKLIAIQLQKLGFEVDQAEDGLPAVEMAKSKIYGLIFMDLDMPGMDGFQATAMIRRHDLDTKQHTPIVAMTSYDREGDKEKCLSTGMDDYLSKGVTKKRLQEVIQRCIRTRKSIQPQVVDVEPPPEDTPITIDFHLLQETYGAIETEEIMDLFINTMKTLTGCLRFALDERDRKSVNHFAYSFKGPCATLGLEAMVALTAGMIKDADNANWERAEQAMVIIESQSKRIIQQWEQWKSTPASSGSGGKHLSQKEH